MVSFFSIKNFKIRKTVVEFFLSFKNFKSRKKVTKSFFSGRTWLSFHMMQEFPGTTFSKVTYYQRRRDYKLPRDYRSFTWK